MGIEDDNHTRYVRFALGKFGVRLVENGFGVSGFTVLAGISEWLYPYDFDSLALEWLPGSRERGSFFPALTKRDVCRVGSIT
jgi:hypothetical protein